MATAIGWLNVPEQLQDDRVAWHAFEVIQPRSPGGNPQRCGGSLVPLRSAVGDIEDAELQEWRVASNYLAEALVHQQDATRGIGSGLWNPRSS